MEAIDPFVFRLSIFVLAIFVGYFVVWAVTPALHTPLMAVTNAISSVIVVGALIAVSVSAVQPKQQMPLLQYEQNGDVYVDHQYQGNFPARPNQMLEMTRTPPSASSSWTSKLLGFVALILASVNIFGGFLVTQRMLAMYRKKGS
jgi:NAD(P) transhydrogenase subunit alpha